MERLELILIIVIGILSIGAIILSVISITKTDNNFDFNLSDSGANIEITKYLESPDGQIEINKAIQLTPLGNDVLSKNTEYIIKSVEWEQKVGGQGGFYNGANGNGEPEILVIFT